MRDHGLLGAESKLILGVPFGRLGSRGEEEGLPTELSKMM